VTAAATTDDLLLCEEGKSFEVLELFDVGLEEEEEEEHDMFEN